MSSVHPETMRKTQAANAGRVCPSAIDSHAACECAQIAIDAEQFAKFSHLLDNPPQPNAGLKRLLRGDRQ